MESVEQTKPECVARQINPSIAVWNEYGSRGVINAAGAAARRLGGAVWLEGSEFGCGGVEEGLCGGHAVAVQHATKARIFSPRVSSRALSAGRLASRAVVQWMIRMVRLIALAKPRDSPLVGNLGD